MKFILLIIVVFALSTGSIPLRKKEIIEPLLCPELSLDSHRLLSINWECQDPMGSALVKNMEEKGQQLEDIAIKMLQPPEPPKNVTEVTPQNVTEAPPPMKDDKTGKGLLTNILDTVKKFFK